MAEIDLSDWGVGFAEIHAAADLLNRVVIRTPTSRSSALDRAGAQVWLKHEELQRTGSFKFRGAYVATATSSNPRLCTVSSGNHGKALARAGRMLGRTVKVHMPHDAPAIKVAGVRAEGAEVVSFHRYRNPQSEVTAALIRDPNHLYVSAHDDPAVIAGAGTIGVEALADVPDLGVLVVPIGGGGCAAGIGLAARHLSPTVMMIGVEPAAGGVTCASLRAGRRLIQPVPHTIADGQTLTTPGQRTFRIMQQVVDKVVLVSDSDIAKAMTLLKKQCGVRSEPSGACAAAAILTGQLDGLIRGHRVGVIISGGNVEPSSIRRN